MKFRNMMIAALACSVISSCKTDDVDDSVVDVEVTVTSPVAAITEDNGSTQISVNLNRATDVQVDATLMFSGNATGGGTDYNVSTMTVIIPAGSTSETVTITAVQDTIEEGNESIIISISAATGANFNSGTNISLVIEDDDVPPAAQFILNEILYDPSNNLLDGDANGDGFYAQAEDEFLEFVNLSTQPLDISGWEIYDDENLLLGTPNHTVSAGTVIQPGKAFVVFGGGTPTGSFGGATVQTSTFGDLNLNNAGDKMTLKDAAGNVIMVFDIEPLSNNPNESYTRNPDLTGEFEQHGTNTPILFSPGTKIDGSPF